jgi:Aerotolerance regulator N-terminal
MSFLFPAFLSAAAVIAIPILVHLFYFRRFRKVYFTNVRFLKEVKDETTNRQKLRNLLVLTMRCLAFLCMVLAFAQPFIPKSDTVKRGEQAVSIYIDNSFSMNARAQDAPLLELAKQRARDIVKAYRVSDRFQILTNGFEGRDQRLISQDEALNRIEEIRIASATRDLSKVLLRQAQCLATGKATDRTAFVVSDFQQNAADVQNFKDSTIQVKLVPMRSVQERNIAIDSVWFDSPVQILNQPASLLVKLTNYSDVESEEVRLSLLHDGQQKPAGTLRLAPRASKVDTVNFTVLHPGWHEARLSITDFPVQFDDDYYLNFYVAEQLRILTINGAQPNKYLNNAFAGASYCRQDNADAKALDYSKFPDYQLIILNDLSTVSTGLVQELKTFAQNGGHILAFPSRNADLNSYNTLLATFEGGTLGSFEPTPRQASQLNTEEFVFKDVYFNKSANLRLPNTQGNFKLSPNRGEAILTYRDGSFFMVKYSIGEGALYCSAAPLDESANDLVRNAEVFVPMVFRMAISGTKSTQIAYTIGKDEVLEAKHRIAASGEMIYKLSRKTDQQNNNPVAVNNNEEFIPEQRILNSKVLLTPGKSVNDPGWYRLRLNSDSTLAEYAFNLNRKESDLSYIDTEQLSKLSTSNMSILDEGADIDFTQLIDEQNQGITLWRWCIIFALLFLALEVLFLRLWKV